MVVMCCVPLLDASGNKGSDRVLHAWKIIRADWSARFLIQSLWMIADPILGAEGAIQKNNSQNYDLSNVDSTFCIVTLRIHLMAMQLAWQRGIASPSPTEKADI